MDNTREKLIELLKQVQDEGCIIVPAGMGDRYDFIRNQVVADHLIANGVTFETDKKVGGWIVKNIKNSDYKYCFCSECFTCGSLQWKVCPVCETKMVGVIDG